MRVSLAGDPHPHRFPGRSEIAEVVAAHDPERLGPGAHVQWRYRLAGRLISRRGHSKTLFLDLQDRSGTIQLLISRDSVSDELYGDVHDLDIGDIAGVGGSLYATKRGQLALSLDSCTLLAKALHPPPDKHAGIDQIETRYEVVRDLVEL